MSRNAQGGCALRNRSPCAAQSAAWAHSAQLMLARSGMLKFVYEAQRPGNSAHIVAKMRAGKSPGCSASEAVSSIYSNCNATPEPLLLVSKGRG